MSWSLLFLLLALLCFGIAAFVRIGDRFVLPVHLGWLGAFFFALASLVGRV